ncbi:MAG: T9SS type A sorting domain-containing protein [Ignavibacteria bacterium]|nr:T9SS type A sorting domain-containing protein [Ignavibacteria bacterium]
MKQATNLFIALFFILGVVKVTQAEEFYITGKVRYADNNEIVTSGVVKLFNEDGSVEAVAPINQYGDYLLGIVRAYYGSDLIGFPNIEPEMDFVPTGYPNVTDPNNFVPLNVTTNLTNIDIYVQRIVALRPNVPLSSVEGKVLNNGTPVKDAIVYAMQGETYFGYGISDSKGNVKITGLPVGDYILVAHKLANTSDSKPVAVTEKPAGNVIFNVTPKTGAITNNTPFTYGLSQNYPNPFNPSTVISYSIPTDGFVSLNVFNSTGQLVKELMNANQSAGSYNVEFNAVHLSSGIYYYMLNSNGYTDTKKMILIK